MADYIYLLESRLSQAQQSAIKVVREIARNKGLTVFLVGGAVRDLTSGSPVRDLDVAVQGNALKLKKDLEKAGASVSGENELMQALFLNFPGSVRIEVGSTLSVHFPKPGKPVVKAATILDDLRRRDFTANAMALSLNEGSYGLLMDPLNGVADIENRELRLVSNYGFIEDPVRMVRAARFAARLGWQMEEKTQARYETGKAEGYIAAMSGFQHGYEAEEIVHEEDPLRVMRRLEHEGWMKHLALGWTSAKANVAELEKLREAQMQLQMRGIHADASAAQFPLLTAKMPPKDVAALKKSFPRRGFVAEIEALEAEGKRFATAFGAKQVAAPSAAWKLLMSARPEAVLWVAHSTKTAGLQAKLKNFYTEWPQARQRIPYTLMQEMRIVPDVPGYDELVEKIFFELMDAKLSTVEEMKAYLEPYSPPAPPPPVHLRRARATKKDAKASKSRKKVNGDEGTDEGEGLDEVAAAAGVGGDVSESARTEKAGGTGTTAAKGKAVPAVKAAAPVKTAAVVKAVVPAKAAAKKAAPVKVAASVSTNKGSAVKAGKAAPPAKPVMKKAAAKKPAKAAKKIAVKKVLAKKPAKSPAKAAGKPAAGKAKSKTPVKSMVKASAKATKGKPATKAAKKPASKSSSRKR